MTSGSKRDAREQLHAGVRVTAKRGRMIASLRVGIFSVAVLLGGLFVLAMKDAVFVLPDRVRVALLVVLLLAVLIVTGVRVLGHWRDRRFSRAAGEQIDLTAQNKSQPVTTGLSLHDRMDDDTLALMLMERAEARAAAVAKSVKPSRAYPLRLLMGPGRRLLLVAGLWLLLAIIVPSQVLGIVSRVLMPWRDAPPFSLTQMEPTWTPQLPAAGENVTVRVEPSGLMPEAVDWVRLDEQGEEAERFTMLADGQGGFDLVLKRVQSAIDFKLETNGRYTRTYTIVPTPREANAAQDDRSDERGSPDTNQGATTFDPDMIARRDLTSHRDWPAIRDRLQKLLEELAKAQALAESIDPADAEALADLSARIAELVEDAKLIASDLAAIQGDLPAQASALIDAMDAALTQMQSASLPTPPSQASSAPGSGEPTASQWLSDAAKAAKADQQQIGQGLGPSTRPIDEGTASGEPGQGPAVNDPSATGTSTQLNPSGQDGVLPDSVMQQVPPSYRDFVSAYFEKRAAE